MSSDYILLAVTAILGCGGGLCLLAQAKRYRAARRVKEPRVEGNFGVRPQDAVLRSDGKTHIMIDLDNDVLEIVRARANAESTNCETMITELLSKAIADANPARRDLDGQIKKRLDAGTDTSPLS